MPHYIHSFAEELEKIAADEKKSPGLSIAKLLGVGAAGFGAGTAGGLVAGLGADAVSQHLTGKKLPRQAWMGAAPLLGGSAGIAYALYKAHEQEAVRSALKDQTEQRSATD